MTQIPPPRTRQECEALDRADPLGGVRGAVRPARWRDLSRRAFAGARHACGAGAGRRGRRARSGASGLIRSWNDAGWFDLPRTHRRQAGAADRRGAGRCDRHGQRFGEPVQAGGRAALTHCEVADGDGRGRRVSDGPEHRWRASRTGRARRLMRLAPSIRRAAQRSAQYARRAHPERRQLSHRRRRGHRGVGARRAEERAA